MSYSESLRDHFLHPRDAGEMEDPDVVGLAGTPGEGPHMQLFLRLSDGRISETKYLTYGCAAAIAAGSALTVLVKDRSLQACSDLGVDDIVAELGGMPPEKMHCAELAISCLRDALSKLDMRNVRREGG